MQFSLAIFAAAVAAADVVSQIGDGQIQAAATSVDVETLTTTYCPETAAASSAASSVAAVSTSAVPSPVAQAPAANTTVPVFEGAAAVNGVAFGVAGVAAMAFLL